MYPSVRYMLTCTAPMITQDTQSEQAKLVFAKHNLEAWMFDRSPKPSNGYCAQPSRTVRRHRLRHRRLLSGMVVDLRRFVWACSVGEHHPGRTDGRSGRSGSGQPVGDGTGRQRCDLRFTWKVVPLLRMSWAARKCLECWSTLINTSLLNYCCCRKQNTSNICTNPISNTQTQNEGFPRSNREFAPLRYLMLYGTCDWQRDVGIRFELDPGGSW